MCLSLQLPPLSGFLLLCYYYLLNLVEGRLHTTLTHYHPSRHKWYYKKVQAKAKN